MNRFIIGIITFLLTFGISTSVVGLLFGFPEVGRSYSSGSHVSRNIKRVLDSDVRYGETRRRSQMRLLRNMKSVAKRGEISEDQGRTFVAKYAEVIERYSDRSSAIDVSHTPADFRYAWNKHMDAWAKEAEASATRRFGDKIDNSDKDSEVNATWYQVLRIAKRYRVPIRSRYLR